MRLKQDSQLFCAGDGNAYLVRSSGGKSLRVSGVDYSKITSWIRALKSPRSFDRPTIALDGDGDREVFQRLCESLRANEFFADDDLDLFEFGERLAPQLAWLETVQGGLARHAMIELQRAHVVIVGVGSLGSCVVQQLALLGIRSFTLIDPDVVEPSNLNRQSLFSESDIGKPKVECARNWLARFCSSTRVSVVQRLVCSHRDLHSFIADRSNLVVLTADTPREQIVFETGKYCRATNTPWLRVWRQGIGPLCGAPEDSCSGCLLPSVTDLFPEARRHTDISLNSARCAIGSQVTIGATLAAHYAFLFLSRLNPGCLRDSFIRTDISTTGLMINTTPLCRHQNCPCH